MTAALSFVLSDSAQGKRSQSVSQSISFTRARASADAYLPDDHVTRVLKRGWGTGMCLSHAIFSSRQSKEEGLEQPACGQRRPVAIILYSNVRLKRLWLNSPFELA